jgi:hypothetical protein
MRNVWPSRLPSTHPSGSGPPSGPQPAAASVSRATVACGSGGGLLGFAWVDGGRDGPHPGAGGPRRRHAHDLLNNENWPWTVKAAGVFSFLRADAVPAARLERQREGGRPEGARGPPFGAALKTYRKFSPIRDAH